MANGPYRLTIVPGEYFTKEEKEEEEVVEEEGKDLT